MMATKAANFRGETHVKIKSITALAAAILAASTGAAFAHAGPHNDMGFMAGLTHALTETDHQMALAAFLIWAGLATALTRRNKLSRTALYVSGGIVGAICLAVVSL